MSVQNLDFKINAAVEAGNSAQTLGELKKSLRELQGLAAQVGPGSAEEFSKITTAAGQLNDRIKDVREQTAALTGTPFERLTNNFRNVKQAIFEMDLDKFKNSLIGIKNSFMEFGGMVLSPFKNLGVAIGGLITGTTTLTAAMRALGGAIAATGIGLLVIGVAALVTYWDKLKDAGGAIGNTFKAVNTILEDTKNYFYDILVQLGLIEDKRRGKGVPEGVPFVYYSDEDYKRFEDDLKKEIQALDNQYEKKKKIREADRKNVFKTSEEESAYKRQWEKNELKYELEHSEKRYKIVKEGVPKQNEEVKARLRATNKLIREYQKELEANVPDVLQGYYFQDPNRPYSELPNDLLEWFKGSRRLAQMREAIPQLQQQKNDLENSLKITKQFQKDFESRDDEHKQRLKEAQIKYNNWVTQDSYAQYLKGKELRDKELEDQYKALKARYDAQLKAEKDASAELGKRATGMISEEELANASPEMKLLIQKQRIDDELNLIYDKSRKTLEDDSNLKTALEANERDFQSKMNALKMENELTWQSAVQSMNEEAINEEKRLADAKLEIQKEAANQRIAVEREVQSLSISIANSGLSIWNELNQQAYNSDLERSGKNEKLQDEANRRNFNRQKNFQTAQAIVNTAAAVAGINGNSAVNADITQTLRTILTGLVIGIGAAQIATIQSQEYKSGFSGGGASSFATPAIATTTVTPGQFFNPSDFKPGDVRERRVYVVESEISGVQRKVQVIQNRAKF